ncbi:hypothetical protein [Halomarina oriensis]|uniref:Uncharacterized protein n=1 Tax=Halomarina oriensis TaxID=671145 RepID=A0A6B0GNX1_9EURY|nr:hypothetical protein [Halomarina oriensis]MWG36626.1 hypothetical protein [Halomarina oriensis]
MKRRALLAVIGTAATAGCSSVTGAFGDNSEEGMTVSSEYTCIELQDPPCIASVTVDKMGNATQLIAKVPNSSGTTEQHVISTEGGQLEIDGLRPEQEVELYAKRDDKTILFQKVPTPEQRKRELPLSNSSDSSHSTTQSR